MFGMLLQDSWRYLKFNTSKCFQYQIEPNMSTFIINYLLVKTLDSHENIVT